VNEPLTQENVEVMEETKIAKRPEKWTISADWKKPEKNYQTN
jgi:hypothetical protein